LLACSTTTPAPNPKLGALLAGGGEFLHVIEIQTSVALLSLVRVHLEIAMNCDSRMMHFVFIFSFI
jgi:hypothetical protein